MDRMDRYKIRKSIEDVIGILDSAPIRPDLIRETNYVQLTNRVPIAHLAIERGLKALISDGRGDAKQIHGLNKLYQDLKEYDKESADYLGGAFEDAVSFFGYQVGRPRFGHFRSLENYLAKVGTEKAFEELRYWAIGESSKGESPIPFISPPIHRELLCALWCVFRGPTRWETVSTRVEREVGQAMFHRRHLFETAEDEGEEQSIRWYKDWLFNDHSTRRDALKDAVRMNFAVTKGDGFLRQTLYDAYIDLSNSKDPAVLYFIRKLKYLPSGSQRRDPDAVPEVQFNQEKTRGIVLTPAGTCLGSIDKLADGAWEITPNEDGLGPVAEIAESQADAKNYLVNRRTGRVTVTTNGESRLLRILTQWGGFPQFRQTTSEESTEGVGFHTTIYDLEFWDTSHGVTNGDEISIMLESEEYDRSATWLQGIVMGVDNHWVSILGLETIRHKDEIDL